jgi:hypothetical protein
VLVLVSLLACGGGGGGGAGGMAGQAGDDQLFVPEGLPNTNVNGQDEGLILVASTLVREATGSALYVAVRNDLDTPLCQPGMSTDFYDKAGQKITSAASVVQTDRWYGMGDGTVIACLAPGQIGMAAATNIPDLPALEELGYLKHLFPTFIVQDIAPVEGLTVADLKIVAKGTGHAFAGQLVNGLDVAVSAAAVAIFPVNRVGRPLGVATGAATTDVPSGGSWPFETDTVEALGVDYLAFPSASISQ